MEMNMVDSLPPGCITIGYQSVPGFSNTVLSSEFFGNFKNPPDKSVIIKGIKVCNMRLRNDQKVNRSLRLHIMKGNDIFILVYKFSRKLAFYDIAENTL